MALRPRLMHLLTLLVVVAGGSCTTTNPLQPDGTLTLLGPIPLPELGLGPLDGQYCAGPRNCPTPKPFGASTLVGVATCDYATGSAACTPTTTVCPLVDPSGNQAFRFLVGDRNCTSVVDILLQSSGDGGAGVEWRVQERELEGNRCVSKGAPRIGVANVLGSCCSTQVDLDVREHGRTFRFIARTDWIAKR